MDTCTVSHEAHGTVPAADAFGELPTERLESLICQGAANLTAAEHRWLLAVAEFERRQAWQHWGLPSCAHWLSWQVGLDLRAAREKVRVAVALTKFASISEEMSAGHLSYTKVRAITRVVNEASEADWVQLALAGTTAQVELLVTTYRRVTPPPGTDGGSPAEPDDERPSDEPADRAGGDPQWRARSLTARANDDRTVTIVLRLPTSEAMEFLGSLEPFVAKPDQFDPADDPLAARRADAAVDAIRSAVAASPKASRRPLTTLRVDLDVLAAHLSDEGSGDDPTVGRGRDVAGTEVGPRPRHLRHPEGCCEMSTSSSSLVGPIGVATETVLRALCDCDVETLLERAGQPQGVSKRRGLVNGRLRALVMARDHHRCRFPGCGRPIGLDVHHLQHRARGGGNSPSNLMVLCRFHHHQLHEGGWKVVHTPEALEFHGPSGVVLTDTPPVPQGDARPVDEHRRTAKDGRSQWQGDRLNLGLAIDIIQWNERRRARWPDPNRWDDDPHHAVHVTGSNPSAPV